MHGKRPTIASRRGMVAAAHPLAAAAGAQTLAAGGNAFDAAVATCAALNVAEPYMSGLAGCGMAVAYIAAEQRIRTLDYITRVPRHFPAGTLKSREDLHFGALSVATPGNLAGWCELHGSYGTKPLADVLAPAIALAEEGVPLIEFNASAVGIGARVHGPAVYGEAWRATYGTVEPREGAVLRQPDLARTLRAIAADGPGHLYGGPLGRAIVAHLQSLGGCITADDLADTKPAWLEPLSVPYRDVVIHSLPPPAEAFQLLLTLRLLDDRPAGSLDEVEGLDRMWRAIRLAAGLRIDRNNPNPQALAEILGDASLDALRARLDDGVPVDGPTEQFVAPSPPDPDREHTTSLSIADAAGNVVCITQSLGAVFGSGIVVPGTGVTLNNFLYWGEVDPRGTNFLAPGRPLALPMAPTISTRNGRPVLALGTPGSYGICQTQAQALARIIDEGMAAQAAIEAPRARLWDGRLVHAEGRIAADVLETLRERGHEVVAIDAFSHSCGGMQAVAIDSETGVMTGAADPRRDGYVVPV